MLPCNCGGYFRAGWQVSKRRTWQRAPSSPFLMTGVEHDTTRTAQKRASELVLNIRTILIQYKIALTSFHFVSGTPPPDLSDMLHLYSPSRSLRSASDAGTFHVPRMGRRTLGERSFQYIGPVIWNSLPPSVMHSFAFSSFKSKLKTHVFSSVYWSVFSLFLFFYQTKYLYFVGDLTLSRQILTPY